MVKKYTYNIDLSILLRKGMLYFTAHSTHCIYGYTVLNYLHSKGNKCNTFFLDLPSSTWYRATQACKARGQELYHSADKFLVAGFLDVNSGRHWIGAKVMYSPWKWTGKQRQILRTCMVKIATRSDNRENTKKVQGDVVK